MDLSSGWGATSSLADVWPRPLQRRNAGERMLHRLGGVQHLDIGAEAPRDLKAERHALVVDAAGQ